MLDTKQLRTDVNGLVADVAKWKNVTDFYGFSKQKMFEHMQGKYKYLYENSSTLYSKCIDGEIDLPRLEEMLAMIDQVNKGKDYFTASKEIGESLTDTYVKPLLEKK